MRRLRRAVLPVLALVAAVVGWTFLADRVAREVRERIAAEASRLALDVRIEELSVGLWPPLRLRGLTVERPGRWHARLEAVSVTLRPRGTHGWGFVAWASLGEGRLDLPAGLYVELLPSEWEVRPGEAALRGPAEGLTVRTSSGPDGARIDVLASQWPAGTWLRPGFDDAVLPELGLVDAELHAVRGTEGVDLRGRLAAVGVAARGTATVSGPEDEARLEARLELEGVAFAELLDGLGIDRPFGARDLGSLSGVVEVAGPLRKPEALGVRQALRFRPPAPLPREVVALRADFTHEVREGDGSLLAVEVATAAPDFVARAEVPPLFVRALLLAEDFAFETHPGLDLRELPGALATNWNRGSAARGGSTITQQLAKNLFLSREKSLDRKLKELVLAFLLESALGKDRILEIYLNVIEWGPGLYGLRPAARHYFAKEPKDLSVKETAFLVALIPGPRKYQRSFADGTLSPGFEPLVVNILDKLRATAALSEDEYAAARAETLEFRRDELQPPE